MNEQEELRHLENLKIIQEFCLFDDVFMTKCLENAPKCVELVLRIILEMPDLQVIESQTQVFMANLLNRSVKLDVFATDSKQTKYNIEIQKANNGAGYKRARYHSSILDAKMLEKGEDFDDLPETYVIFITEKDFVGKGLPLYQIERCILQTNETVEDGEHIIYVNGACRENTPLGRLMQDFSNKNPATMNYEILADRVKFFKESKEGTTDMSSILEEYFQKRMEKDVQKSFQQGINENKRETARRMLMLGKLSLEEVADVTGLTLDEVKRLKDEKSA